MKQIVHAQETVLPAISASVGHVLRILQKPAVVPLGDQLFVSAANFALGILVARLVGVAEFGQFTLALFLAALGVTLINYLMCAPMMTLAGSRQNRSLAYFSAVMRISTVLSALMALCAAGVIAGLIAARDGAMPWPLFWASAHLTLGLAVHNALRRTYFAQGRAGLALAIDLARFVFLAIAVGVALLIRGDDDISAELVLHALGGGALLASLPGLVTLCAHRAPRRLWLSVLQRHWPMARWLVLMVVVSIGQEQLIWMMVSYQLGDAAVGGLRSAHYLLGVTHFIMMAMENFVPRQAARHHAERGRQGLLSYLTLQTVLLGGPTAALIIAVCAPAQIWLDLFFGAEFAQYAPSVWLFGTAYLCIFLRDLWSYYLRTIEHTRAMFTSMAVSSIGAAIMIVPALDWFGPLGAAVVMAAAHALSMIYMFAMVARHHLR
ncbi:MAG: hypothetical protein AAFO79_00055 [Pseudomonadota bacterium]